MIRHRTAWLCSAIVVLAVSAFASTCQARGPRGHGEWGHPRPAHGSKREADGKRGTGAVLVLGVGASRTTGPEGVGEIDFKPSYRFGALARVANDSPLAFEIGLLYEERGAGPGAWWGGVDPAGTMHRQEQELDLRYLTLPFLCDIRFGPGPVGPYAIFGPELSWLIEARSTEPGPLRNEYAYSRDLTHGFNRIYPAVYAGAGIAGRGGSAEPFLELGFTFGLGGLTDRSSVETDPARDLWRNPDTRSVVLSAGLRF